MRKHSAGLRLVDVAEQAGVSIATASRALSGAAGVSEALAERVRAVAADLGYVANVHARSLASGASPGIGLVVHEIGDPYFAEIASGVLEVAGTHGRMVQICHTGRDPYTEVAQLRALVNARVGIIVVAGSGHLDRDVQARMKAEVNGFEAAGGGSPSSAGTRSSASTRWCPPTSRAAARSPSTCSSSGTGASASRQGRGGWPRWPTGSPASRGAR